MLFSVYCLDAEDGLPKRLEARPAHLEFLESLGSRIKLAGPVLDDKSENPAGSLLIIAADNLDHARQLMAGDPYGQAGVFKSVEVRPWRGVLGEWWEDN